jgi:hypothetical protein
MTLEESGAGAGFELVGAWYGADEGPASDEPPKEKVMGPIVAGSRSTPSLERFDWSVAMWLCD